MPFSQLLDILYECKRLSLEHYREKFFELHAKFEGLYNGLVVKVNEVAERILTLGHTPLHTLSDYTSLSTVKEAKNVSNGKEAIQNILDTFKTLISLQKEIAAASKAGNEGANEVDIN